MYVAGNTSGNNLIDYYIYIRYNNSIREYFRALSSLSRITRVNPWLEGGILFVETVECTQKSKSPNKEDSSWNEDQLAVLLLFC
ncbi:MAG: hypothetical protein RR232_08790, partial [Clostridia bacterium]